MYAYSHAPPPLPNPVSVPWNTKTSLTGRHCHSDSLDVTPVLSRSLIHLACPSLISTALLMAASIMHNGYLSICALISGTNRQTYRRTSVEQTNVGRAQAFP